MVSSRQRSRLASLLSQRIPRDALLQGNPSLLLSPGASQARLWLSLSLVLHRVEVLPVHSQEKRTSGDRSQDHTLSQAATPELLVLPGSLI